MTPRAILDFWFQEVGPKRWFVADAALDDDIKARFEQVWREARAGKHADWESDKQGALALIILLDQFPRNMFRGTAEAFSTDALAQAVAKRALARGDDLEAPAGVRSFYYLPLTHSEDLADQETCLRLTRERLGESHFSFPYAIRHRAAVERFGRFPARNSALGRETTPEEAEFLKTHPAGF
jgi:uncharacterized protein (DUF924 family)